MVRLLLAAILAIALSIQIGCGGSDDRDSSASLTPSLSTETFAPLTKTAPPSNPGAGEEGIEVVTVPTVELGWPPVIRACNADVYVDVRDGVVVGEPKGSLSFTGAVGDLVYNGDGTRSDDPTLVTQPAYMSEDGKIILGFRTCVVTPPPDSLCEEDGLVWEREGSVVEVIMQPRAGKIAAGDTVFGPDGMPLFPTYELSELPVFLNDDGLLEYGWPSCDPPYPIEDNTQASP